MNRAIDVVESATDASDQQVDIPGSTDIQPIYIGLPSDLRESKALSLLLQQYDVMSSLMSSLIWRVEDVSRRLTNIEARLSSLESRSFPTAETEVHEAGHTGIEAESSVDISREEAKEMILKLFEEQGDLDYSEIISSLDLDLKLVVDICAELEEEKRIKADVSLPFGEIANIYEIMEGREAIRRFLEEHQYLYPVLEEAKEKIISVFGEDAKLYLELQHDPEEGVDEFFIVVKSEHSAEEAVMLENKIAEEWLLGKMKETRGNLNIISE